MALLWENLQSSGKYARDLYHISTPYPFTQLCEDNCSWSDNLLGQRPFWNSIQCIHLQINRYILTINFAQLLRAKQKRIEHNITKLKKNVRQNRNRNICVVNLQITGISRKSSSKDCSGVLHLLKPSFHRKKWTWARSWKSIGYE